MTTIPKRLTRALRVSARVGPILVLLFLLVLGSTATARAQDPEPTRDETLSALFSALPPLTDVRLVTMGGAIEEGRVAEVGPRSIDVTTNGSTVPIGYDFVRSVSVQQGHGIKGMVWGASVGAVVGSLFGMMYASFDCTTASDCNYTEQQGALRGGALFAALGGGVGFMLGRNQVHWHPIFP